MGFKPLRSLVAVRRQPITQIGSIILPQEKVADRGEVVAIGPDVTGVAIGDLVIFKQWKPNGPKLNGEQLTLVEETDILLVVDKEGA